jgi:hypothetical protein
MTNVNDWVDNGNWCLAGPNNNMLLVYLKGGSTRIDLTRSGESSLLSYLVNWFDPRNGGPLQFGTVKLLPVGEVRSVGEAPNSPEQDWVVLRSKCSDCRGTGATSDAKGLEAGVVAALVLAGVVALIALALLYFCKQRRKPGAGVFDSETQDPAESGDRAPRDPPETDSACRTFLALPVVTGTAEDSGDPPPAAASSRLPEYKDQTRNASSEGRALVPTARAAQVGQGDPPATFIFDA